MARTLPLLTAEQASGPPPFNRVGIVGLGLVGGSIAMASRRRWPSGLVIGVDSKDVLETAQRLHAVDVAGDDLGMLAEADLVVLCAPVLRNVELLEQLDDAVRGSAVVTDVGSTKQVMVEAARRLPSRFAFVGGHPLAGAARSGIEYASPDLFSDRPWILTPPYVSDRSDAGNDHAVTATSDAVATLAGFVESLGAVPAIMSAAEHDRVMAWVSHLPQLAVSALMRVIGEGAGESGLELAGRGLRDTTRLASSPAHVWIDICRTNADVIGLALDALIDQLVAVRRQLHDSAGIDELFAAAASWRERLTKADSRKR